MICKWHIIPLFLSYGQRQLTKFTLHSGGTAVTSMNPIAKELWEEGVVIETFKLVSQGQFNEEGVKDLFYKVAERPGCSATRRIDHNITDLQGMSLLNPTSMFPCTSPNRTLRSFRSLARSDAFKNVPLLGTMV